MLNRAVGWSSSVSVKLRGSLKMPRKQSSKQCRGLDLTRGITKTNFSHCFVSSVISWRVPALLCLWRLSAWRCCSSTSGDKPRMTTMTLTGGWSDSCTYSTVVGKHRAVHINLLQESLVLNLRSYVFVDWTCNKRFSAFVSVVLPLIWLKV